MHTAPWAKILYAPWSWCIQTCFWSWLFMLMLLEHSFMPKSRRSIHNWFCQFLHQRSPWQTAGIKQSINSSYWKTTSHSFQLTINNHLHYRIKSSVLYLTDFWHSMYLTQNMYISITNWYWKHWSTVGTLLLRTPRMDWSISRYRTKLLVIDRYVIATIIYHHKAYQYTSFEVKVYKYSTKSQSMALICHQSSWYSTKYDTKLPITADTSV